MIKTVIFERVHEDAVIPKYAHGALFDAGMDLHSVDDVVLEPGETFLVSTGLKIQLPPDTEAQIRSRSGLALKYSVVVLNSPGTVDPGYRGVIGVILHNHGKNPFRVMVGDRIAQMVIAPYISAYITEGSVDKSGLRGEGGFGSTGTN